MISRMCFFFFLNVLCIARSHTPQEAMSTKDRAGAGKKRQHFVFPKHTQNHGLPGIYIAPPLLGPVGHQALLLSVVRHGTT